MLGQFYKTFSRHIPGALADASGLTFWDGKQQEQGQIGRKRGVLSVPHRAVARKARRVGQVDDVFVITYPLGNCYRYMDPGPGTSAGYDQNYRALPVLPWAATTQLMEWAPDMVYFAFPPRAEGEPDAADFDWINLMPYHEQYDADPASTKTFPVALGTGLGTTHRKQTQMLELYNKLRIAGSSVFCTMELKLQFLPPCMAYEVLDGPEDHRVRLIMLQLNEETVDIGYHEFQLGHFFDFAVSSDLNAIGGLDTPRIPEYKKDKTVPKQNVSYTVLIDQIIDCKSNDTSFVKPKIHIRQPMGCLSLDQTTDIRSAQPKIDRTRAGRIIWGIYQLNAQLPKEDESFYNMPVSWKRINQMMWHGDMKIIFNDSNF